MVDGSGSLTKHAQQHATPRVPLNQLQSYGFQLQAVEGLIELVLGSWDGLIMCEL